MARTALIVPGSIRKKSEPRAEPHFGASVQARASPCDLSARGKCLFGKNMCFQYGESGHIALQCTEPLRKKDDNQDKKLRGKATLFYAEST